MVHFTGRRQKKRAPTRGDANPAKLPRCCRNHQAVSRARSPVRSRKRRAGIRNGAGSGRLACHRADARVGERLDGANDGRPGGRAGAESGRISKPRRGNIPGSKPGRLPRSKPGRRSRRDAGGVPRASAAAGAALHGGIRAVAHRDREAGRGHQGCRRQTCAAAGAVPAVHALHRVRGQGGEVHGEERRRVRHPGAGRHHQQGQSRQGSRDQGPDLRRRHRRGKRGAARARARRSARHARHPPPGHDEYGRRHARFAQRQSTEEMSAAGRVADSTGNWVDRRAPGWARPYLRLARADRPIGSWLLLLPCWWSAALAADHAGAATPNPWHLVLFAIGTVAMRGAGCTWNDLVDRDLDARVERTRSRPIPSGDVSVKAARGFLVLQALIGLAVRVPFNAFTIALGVASLAVPAVYPRLQRLTYWPPIGLGLAFSWGALMGWAAALGRVDGPALLLYAGSIAWVIGYDTIYAHQDREDDALIGIKSTALLFGERTKPALAAFYAAAVLLIGLAGLFAGAGLVVAAGVALFAPPLGSHVPRLAIAHPPVCLPLFTSYRLARLLPFPAIVLDGLVRQGW